MSDGTTVETVVVTANNYGDVYINLGNGYRGYETFGSGAPENYNQGKGDSQLILKATNPNNQATVAQVLADGMTLAKTVASLDPQIDALNANAQYLLPGSQTYNGSRYETGAQIQSTWDRTTFTVSDNQVYGNGGIGAAIYGGPNGQNTDELSTSAIEQYGKFNDGDQFLLLHEISHLTDQGYAFNQLSQNDYGLEVQNHWVAPGYSSSDQWYNNEAYANDSANAIATSLGLDVSAIYSGFGQLGETHARNPQTLVNLDRLNAHG